MSPDGDRRIGRYFTATVATARPAANQGPTTEKEAGTLKRRLALSRESASLLFLLGLRNRLRWSYLPAS